MPTYSYTHWESCETIEVNRSMHDPSPETILVDGREYWRDLNADSRRPTRKRVEERPWPKISKTVGGLRKEKKALEKRALALGVPTEFVVVGKQCKARFDDPSHQNRYCKALHLTNQDAGYSDYVHEKTLDDKERDTRLEVDVCRGVAAFLGVELIDG